MSVRIVYQIQGSPVAIAVPTEEYLRIRTLEQIIAQAVPEGAPYAVLEDTDIPVEQDFRDAWDLVDGAIIPNFAKSVELTKIRLRQERAPLLADLDVEFQRALETNADTTAIVAEKNRLRDITKEADKCTTLEELRSLTCLQVNNVV